MDTKDQVLAWLGCYRDHLPTEAISSLQEIVNPRVTTIKPERPNLDVKVHGWSFGTYFKSCPDCPDGKLFMGDARSVRCHDHAAARHWADLDDATSADVVHVHFG